MEFIQKLHELVDYWFTNKNQWFNSTSNDDKLITDKFLSLFDMKYDESKLIDDFRSGLGWILLYDQIIRHVERHLENKIDGINIDEINIDEINIVAFAEKFYIRNKYELNSDQFAFVLLPLRHSRNFNKIFYVIRETINKIKEYPKDLGYRRFLRATLDRYCIQCDDTINIEHYVPQSTSYAILDDMGICDLGLAVYRPQLIVKNIPEKFGNFCKEFQKQIAFLKNQPIIISLSGGVDSMVMSYLLTKYYSSENIIAVHINYNNRKECVHEVSLLKSWCDFLGIQLNIRKITELNRPECMDLGLRDDYETYTRNIRYATYCNSNTQSEPIVFLGHNHDDSFENILTNITSESHYDNLTGMDFITKQTFNDKDITFVRPMLNIVKKDIYSLANYLQIPHFADSTPKWSQRGKIRDHIRPAIEAWNPKAIESFFELSGKVSKLMLIVDTLSVDIAQNIKKEKQLIININSIYDEIIFENVFRHLSIKVSHKGLTSFHDKLIYIKDNFNSININSKNYYQLNKETKLSWIKIDVQTFIIVFP